MPKLIDRQPVEGTTPTICIGKRTYHGPDGAVKVSRKWYAEYCVDSRQQWAALDTTNKAQAHRLTLL